MSASHRLCGRRQILVTVLFVALCPSLISSRLLGLSLPNDASPRLPTLPLRVAFEDKDLYSVAKPTTTEASDEMVRAFVVAKVEADEAPGLLRTSQEAKDTEMQVPVLMGVRSEPQYETQASSESQNRHQEQPSREPVREEPAEPTAAPVLAPSTTPVQTEASYPSPAPIRHQEQRDVSYPSPAPVRHQEQREASYPSHAPVRHQEQREPREQHVHFPAIRYAQIVPMLPVSPVDRAPSPVSTRILNPPVQTRYRKVYHSLVASNLPLYKERAAAASHNVPVRQEVPRDFQPPQPARDHHYHPAQDYRPVQTFQPAREYHQIHHPFPAHTAQPVLREFRNVTMVYSVTNYHPQFNMHQYPVDRRPVIDQQPINDERNRYETIHHPVHYNHQQANVQLQPNQHQLRQHELQYQQSQPIATPRYLASPSELKMSVVAPPPAFEPRVPIILATVRDFSRRSQVNAAQENLNHYLQQQQASSNAAYGQRLSARRPQKQEAPTYRAPQPQAPQQQQAPQQPAPQQYQAPAPQQYQAPAPAPQQYQAPAPVPQQYQAPAPVPQEYQRPVPTPAPQPAAQPVQQYRPAPQPAPQQYQSVAQLMPQQYQPAAPQPQPQQYQQSPLPPYATPQSAPVRTYQAPSPTSSRGPAADPAAVYQEMKEQQKQSYGYTPQLNFISQPLKVSDQSKAAQAGYAPNMAYTAPPRQEFAAPRYSPQTPAPTTYVTPAPQPVAYSRPASYAAQPERYAQPQQQAPQRPQYHQETRSAPQPAAYNPQPASAGDPDTLVGYLPLVRMPMRPSAAVQAQEQRDAYPQPAPYVAQPAQPAQYQPQPATSPYAAQPAPVAAPAPLRPYQQQQGALSAYGLAIHASYQKPPPPQQAPQPDSQSAAQSVPYPSASNTQYSEPTIPLVFGYMKQQQEVVREPTVPLITFGLKQNYG